MRILIADDSLVSRRMLEAMLAKWGYEVITTEDGNAAWEKLKAPDAPRIALLDWMMPGQNGVDVCLQARESMRFKATHDTLTGVWNRGTILETMDREVWRSRREGLPLGVLIVDLDHFKSVNDTYGHLAGDSVLLEITKRMQMNVRPYDAVGRYGGEEFLVLLPGCDGSATQEKAERLRNATSREPVATAAGDLKVTMSIGGVTTADWPADSANHILQMADSALYRAKKEGRNRTVMAGAAEHEEAHHGSLELSSQGPKDQ